MNLQLFKEGKFYSLLEINEKIFSLLNYNNKNILYIMDLNKKEEKYKILENINLKRENLIKLDDNNLIIGGYNVIYVYDVNKNEVIKIDCNYIICSLYLLKDKGILFGDNKGNLVKIKSIFNFEEIFKKEDKDIKDEIDSLGEFNNDKVIYKNNTIYKIAEITDESK